MLTAVAMQEYTCKYLCVPVCENMCKSECLCVQACISVRLLYECVVNIKHKIHMWSNVIKTTTTSATT